MSFVPKQIAHLEGLIAALRAEGVALRAELAQSQARVVELERCLGRDSGNSRQPPSSDGLRKPPRRPRSLRRRSGRLVGGQPGQADVTLRALATPDQVVHHHPEQCAQFRAALSGPLAAVPYQARQLFDLPAPPSLAVTEHRVHTVTCDPCRSALRASWPSAKGADSSGCCAAPCGRRSWPGAADFALLRSVETKARKLGWNRYRSG